MVCPRGAQALRAAVNFMQRNSEFNQMPLLIPQVKMLQKFEYSCQRSRLAVAKI